MTRISLVPQTLRFRLVSLLLLVVCSCSSKDKVDHKITAEGEAELLRLTLSDPMPLHEKARVSSPDSLLDAIIVEKGTHATVPTPTEVYIVQAGEAPEGEPVFRGDHLSNISLSWADEETVNVVVYSARSFLEKDTVSISLPDGRIKSIAVNFQITKRK